MNSDISSFEAEKNKKAFSYTAIVCAILLAIFILYTWPLQIPPVPTAQDLIEINLGNDKEGMGDVQPLVKGNPAPEAPPVNVPSRSSVAKEEPAKDIQADENDDPEAAPITKPKKINNDAKILPKETITKPVKVNNPTTAVVPTPAPPKPKIALYKGGNGTGGNGANEDNGYRNQGYKPGNGDAGSPTGNPDSYGKNPGGRVGGGPSVTSGDRKIVHYYSFPGELDRAKIYAIIKVSPEGNGSFQGFGRNSSSTSRAYSDAISNYLRSMVFNKSDHESTVTVFFNFDIKN